MSVEIENAKSLIERESQVKLVKTKNITIVDDGSNECGIPGFPYRFRACGDKVLVSVDVFKSGYECRECQGTGSIHTECICESHSRPGFKYSQEQINDFDKEVSFNVSVARAQITCPACSGAFVDKRQDITCPACQGKKMLLELPDSAKSLPTTGVIVSMGEGVSQVLNLKLHDRVLFGGYSGVMIPTKAPGIVFKVLRDIEVLCSITGGEELAVFDFVTIDKDL